MNRSIESLARAYQDQTLSDDEVRELDQLLRTDAEAREVFLHETNLIAALEDIACDEAAEVPTFTSLSLTTQRHDESSHASPLRLTMTAGWFVAAVIVGRNGTTMVLDRSTQFTVLATNELDERFDASPALAGKQLFLRGATCLYCIEKN